MEMEKKKIKDLILSVRFSKVIQDPFREFSDYRQIHGVPSQSEVSIWAAYRLGHEQAYKEIISAIGDRETL